MFNPGSQFSREIHSPPLHHPVPQHPSIHTPTNLEATVSISQTPSNQNLYTPKLNSNPSRQQQSSFGSNDFGASTALNSIGSTQPVKSQGQIESGFGGFQQYLNDPSAQIGLTVGRNALNYGQEYIGKNVRLD